MALRNVLFENNLTLRKISKKVENFDDNLIELLDDLKETMRKNDGVGIAAVQVGVLRRVLVIEANGIYLECINPELLKHSGVQQSEEGCLSVRNTTGMVKRPYAITIKAQNRIGEPFTFSCEGLTSIVLCHEMDHLDGILFIDRIEK